MQMITGAGSDLATLTPSKHYLLRCTTGGSGFAADTLYIANSTETGYVACTMVSGGTSSALPNPKFIDTQATFNTDIRKIKWVESHASGGTATDDTDGTTGEQSIKLSTGATSGARAQITQVGLKQDFGVNSGLQFKSRIATLSSLVLRGGVNCDPVTSADSNTAAYAAEICTATNNNWQIRTASGSNKNVSDTTIAATTNRQALKLEHTAVGTIKVTLTIDSNAAAQSTTTVPTTGQVGANNNLIRFSIKNSTAANRDWFVYGCRLAYTVSDNWV